VAACRRVGIMLRMRLCGSGATSTRRLARQDHAFSWRWRHLAGVMAARRAMTSRFQRGSRALLARRIKRRRSTALTRSASRAFSGILAGILQSGVGDALRHLARISKRHPHDAASKTAALNMALRHRLLAGSGGGTCSGWRGRHMRNVLRETSISDMRRPMATLRRRRRSWTNVPATARWLCQRQASHFLWPPWQARRYEHAAVTRREHRGIIFGAWRSG